MTVELLEKTPNEERRIVMKIQSAVLREPNKPLTIEEVADAMIKREIKGRWVCEWD